MDSNKKNGGGREQEIIKTASQVFARLGYKKVTMDDVAEKMNITRSALYYYYGNKEDLFLEVVKYEFMLYEKKLKSFVAGAKTTDERFKKFCRCLFPLILKFRDMYNLVSDYYPFSLETHFKIKKIIRDINRAMIIEILKGDKKIGKLDNIEYYSTLLLSSVRGLIFNSHPDELDNLEHDILMLCKVFCNGLYGEIKKKAKV